MQDLNVMIIDEDDAIKTTILYNSTILKNMVLV